MADLRAVSSDSTKKKFLLPLWAKLVIAVTPIYIAAMYWAEVNYEPDMTRRQILHRPYLPLLDSKVAAVTHDREFEEQADKIDDRRSDILLFEDGKLLGPAHTPLYEMAVLGMGRYAHWRHNYSAFAFSSSDNTDPNTNGRVYWTERATK